MWKTLRSHAGVVKVSRKLIRPRVGDIGYALSTAEGQRRREDQIAQGCQDMINLMQYYHIFIHSFVQPVVETRITVHI